MKIAYIQASWHTDITDRCKESCLEELAKKGVNASDIDHFEVPGSLEIPVISLHIAESGFYDIILASGFVVDGGIYRHDFVAQSVIQGITQVSLQTGVPVLSAILTPHHFHEHEEHHRFFSEHMVTKGKELASACLHMIENIQKINHIKNQ